MAIDLKNAVTIAEKTIPAKTYDKIWLSHLAVNADNPNEPVRINAKLDKISVDKDGRIEVLPGGSVQYRTQDFFEDCKTDNELYKLMVDLITKLKTKVDL